MNREEFIQILNHMSIEQILSLTGEIGDQIPQWAWEEIELRVAKEAVVEEVTDEANRQFERAASKISRYLEEAI